MSILVIAAHPDDEVLGCGGAIACAADRGEAVHIAILGEGITSRYADPAQADPKDLKRLHTASDDAARILGAKSVAQFGLPDNRFDTVALLDVVKIIEKLVDDLSPEVVFTQHGGDLNVDHLVTFRAVLTATRPMAGSCVKAVYSYEVASSTEWAFQQFEPRFVPDMFVDVETGLDRKIAAMAAYESEARPWPHPRSPESLRSRAAALGSMVGLSAAEGFITIRRIVGRDEELR